MAYDLNGTSQRITFPDNSFLAGAAYSVHIWAYPDVTNVNQWAFHHFNVGGCVIIGRASDSGRSNLWKVYHYDVTSGVELPGATDSQVAGEWQSVGLSADTAADLQLFVNGAEDANSPVDLSARSAIDTSAVLRVGARNNDLEFFNGKLCEAAGWDRVLTAAEWAMLGAGFSALFIPNGLKWYAPLIRSPVDRMGPVGTEINSPTNFAHPRIIYPSAQILQFPPAAAAASNVTSGLVNGGLIA